MEEINIMKIVKSLEKSIWFSDQGSQQIQDIKSQDISRFSMTELQKIP